MFFTMNIDDFVIFNIKWKCLSLYQSNSNFKYLGFTLLPNSWTKDKIPVWMAAARDAFFNLRKPLSNCCEMSLKKLTFGCNTYSFAILLQNLANESGRYQKAVCLWPYTFTTCQMGKILHDCIQLCWNIVYIKNIVTKHWICWFTHVLRFYHRNWRISLFAKSRGE